jgi:hypothetical protein
MNFLSERSSKSTDLLVHMVNVASRVAARTQWMLITSWTVVCGVTEGTTYQTVLLFVVNIILIVKKVIILLFN